MKAKILTSIAILILASLACMTTTQIIEPTPGAPTAPPAASTPLLTKAPAALEENPAGAVFEIPERWSTPAETARPAAEKGRSNYR